jgi:hypothetical protein
MRKAALFAAVMAAVTQLALAVGVAAKAPPIAPIGPHQFFSGLVNGSSTRAVIRMACFGPEPVGGRMGHPLAGQSTAVTQLPANPPSASGPGFTGLARSIEATVYLPTPVAGSPGGGVHLALFDFYNAPAPISTEIELPCAGTGVVVFNPVSGGNTARPADVTVSFVGQP